MDQHTPSDRVIPKGWLAAIAEGEADLANDRSFPVRLVLAELEAANERMSARLEEGIPHAN